MMKKLTQNETFKRLTNRKILLGSLMILFAAIFIGITSFIPFIITKEKLGTAKFWTDELIIVAITILAMVSAMFVGQASNAQDARSEIAKAKVAFKGSVEGIKITPFCQWVKKVLQPNDIQAIKERELRKIGIDDYTVLKLEDSQIIELSNNAQKYGDRYYSKISKEQAEAILDLKDGVKKIHLVEPDYYLTVSSIESDKTTSEKSGREQFVKTMKLVFSISSKIILALVPAIIFAALARDLSQKNVDTAEAWATFFARMFALVSSSFFGYIVGCQMNDIDADYINLKVNTHKKFKEDTNFVPMSQQEVAKQEFVERVKKENEEYSKSIGFGETKAENAVIIRKEE